MTRTRRLAPTLLCLLAACSGGSGTGTTPPVDGQTGSITGHVRESGSGLSGVSVSLGASGSQTTASDGAYAFTNLRAGSYTLTLTLPKDFGLDSGETLSKSAQVQAGKASTVDWTLKRSPGGAFTEITMDARSFRPSSVTVPVGTTVRWTNATATTHTITPNNPSQPGTWTAQTVSNAGGTYTHTFNTAGTYDYVCTIHAGMSGVVKVQ